MRKREWKVVTLLRPFAVFLLVERMISLFPCLDGPIRAQCHTHPLTDTVHTYIHTYTLCTVLVLYTTLHSLSLVSFETFFHKLFCVPKYDGNYLLD